jgi:hypothetical protein
MEIDTRTIIDGAQLAGLVEDMVNVLGNEKAQREFVKRLARSHRYLQSGITEMFIQYLNLVAEGGYDDRNKYTHKMAECAVNAIKKEFPYYFPCSAN